jgi:signal transduction histidine kinase
MEKPVPQVQRIRHAAGGDPDRRAADRALLLERVAVGLAHEGKNPLHNMVLHLQIMSEKLTSAERQGGLPIEKHLLALRDGIGRVDALLTAFGEFAAPEHLPPDLAVAVARAVQLFGCEARRAGVQLSFHGPETLLVSCDSRDLTDAVGHALVSCIEMARESGRVDLHLEPRGAVVVLTVRAEGGPGRREEAEPHFQALRRLAPDAGCELSIEHPSAGGARLSLSFLHPR